MSGICYIIGAGNLYDRVLTPDSQDLVIAADGGYDHILNQHINPDLLIGDFDSLTATPALPKSQIIRLAKEKDDTDTLAAIKQGIKKGFTTFHLYAATSADRLDHTFANIQCLNFLASQHMQGFAFGKGEVLTVISNAKISYPSESQGIISIFSFVPESRKVSITGLKYTLTDSVLSSHFPLGQSNEFTGQPAEIVVQDGTLLIIAPTLYKDIKWL